MKKKDEEEEEEEDYEYEGEAGVDGEEEGEEDDGSTCVYQTYTWEKRARSWYMEARLAYARRPRVRP